MSTSPRSGIGAGRGAIAMAAYDPDVALFRRQLQSIQHQTFRDFTCIISSDGKWESVSKLVVELTGGDDRFTVVGFDDRLGFYGNFERALEYVPEDAAWIALSDQDDYWYPEKLEVLLPYLENNLLAAGQANVVNVDLPSRTISTTGRRNVSFGSLVAQNQFTGGQMVFRSSLLKHVLPFPRLNTRTQVHDHWIAVVAAALGDTVIVDQVIQDYIQHGGNVLGEVKKSSVVSSVMSAINLAETYTGRRTFGSLVSTYAAMSYGWRSAMMEHLARSAVSSAAFPPEVTRVVRGFSRPPQWMAISRILLAGVLRREVALSCAVEYVIGFPAEIMRTVVTPRQGPSA